MTHRSLASTRCSRCSSAHAASGSAGSTTGQTIVIGDQTYVVDANGQYILQTVAATTRPPSTTNQPFEYQGVMYTWNPTTGQYQAA